MIRSYFIRMVNVKRSKIHKIGPEYGQHIEVVTLKRSMYGGFEYVLANINWFCQEESGQYREVVSL